MFVLGQAALCVNLAIKLKEKSNHSNCTIKGEHGKLPSPLKEKTHNHTISHGAGRTSGMSETETAMKLSPRSVTFTQKSHKSLESPIFRRKCFRLLGSNPYYPVLSGSRGESGTIDQILRRNSP